MSIEVMMPQMGESVVEGTIAKWLVHEGIESLSLNPDTVVETWLQLSREADASVKEKVTAS